ncbi:hypothetical protein [Bradyrhizobium ganzhouense]|uniref:hypothetical protein n=1 Tax=Bradyrhizobium ganzhouense TaxID=1179767 RepID=UPI003CF7396B
MRLSSVPVSNTNIGSRSLGDVDIEVVLASGARHSRVAAPEPRAGDREQDAETCDRSGDLLRTSG